MIYFIQAGENGSIKIGRSEDPKKRLRALQTSHMLPLTLLAVLSESEFSEGELHGLFDQYHIRGEWFGPDAITEWLQEIQMHLLSDSESAEQKEMKCCMQCGLEFFPQSSAVFRCLACGEDTLPTTQQKTNAEKELADWICEYPKDLYYEIDIIGREIELRYGQVDILAYAPFGIVAIEIKSGAIKEKDITRTLRHVNDINLILRDLFWERVPEHRVMKANALDCVNCGTPYILAEEIREFVEYPPECFPLFIGTSIDTETYAFAKGAGGMILLWNYAGETKSYWTYPPFQLEIKTQAEIEKHTTTNDYYPNWVNKGIRKHIESISDKTKRMF